MNGPQQKDVERLLRSHGWLLDEMREVSPVGAGAHRSPQPGGADRDGAGLDGCVQLTAIGVRRTPGQFPARQLELLVAAEGVHVISVDGKTTLGPEPRVTTTRVMLAELP